MCRPKTKSTARLIAAAIAGCTLGTALGGCSDLYLDRRDTVALSAGDAIAANEAEQTVDPWPPQSNNKNVAFNGQRMQSAVERYRLNKVVPAQDSQPSATAAAQAQNVTQITVGGSSSNTAATNDTSSTTSTAAQ